MKPVIKVENLGKKYLIGEKQKFYTLRDSITNLFDFRKNKNGNEDFWALKDVNFEVKQGESIGIIGRNGAGKSTLLKILSQITPPTTGKITLHGRVASLLEVGTGFHQELTGRENIFLNGAILGLSRSEIKRKFDEIVAFSEIEKFLDTTVKHYSSGMYMRLAFAVAAHLESEILIVDEVLAVGDAQFQKKCLGKMDQVAEKEGRTVLFVSHNLGAIEQLCKRCILLDKGIMTDIGITQTVTNIYLKKVSEYYDTPVVKRIDRTGDGLVKITDIKITDESGGKNIRSFDRLNIIVVVDKKIKDFSSSRLVLGFYDAQSRPLFRIDSEEDTKGHNGYSFVFKTGSINLAPQLCTVNAALFINGSLSDYLGDACSFEISESQKKNVQKFSKELATILIETTSHD